MSPTENHYPTTRLMVRLAVIAVWAAAIGSWAVFVFGSGQLRGIIDALLAAGLLLVYSAVAASLHVVLMAMHAIFDIASDTAETALETKRQTLVLHRLAKQHDTP